MINKALTTTALLLIVYLLPAYLAGAATSSNTPLLVLFIVMILAALTQPKYNPLDSNPPKEDQFTSRQIVWSVYATQLFGSLEMSLLRAPQSAQWDAISSAALSIAIAGLAFRAWAVYKLGRFFTWHVTIQEGQQVVTGGPFRFVRHPSYTGALLLYPASLIMIHAWYAAIAAVVLMIVAFKRRIVTEEKLLTERLGQPYIDYSKSVKMLIPYIW